MQCEGSACFRNQSTAQSRGTASFPLSTMTPLTASSTIQSAIKSIHPKSRLENFSFLPKIETAQDVIAFAKEHECTVMDLTFVDVPGTLQHTSKPIHELEDVLRGGAGFDGSSIRGFQQIQESDMLLIPDSATAFLYTFSSEPTVSLLCDVKDPVSAHLYDSSPRTVAHRAIAYLKESGIADTAYFGPEAEFFIFDNVQFDQGPGGAFYKVDSNEAIWNTGREEQGGNHGYKIRHKEGYFPSSP